MLSFFGCGSLPWFTQGLPALHSGHPNAYYQLAMAMPHRAVANQSAKAYKAILGGKPLPAILAPPPTSAPTCAALAIADGSSDSDEGSMNVIWEAYWPQKSNPKPCLR